MYIYIIHTVYPLPFQVVAVLYTVTLLRGVIRSRVVARPADAFGYPKGVGPDFTENTAERSHKSH